MDFWTPQHTAFVLAIVILTTVAAYTDLRYHRIKNWLTLPFFAAGWIYQFWAHGPAGLLDGFYGFLLGFGTYFALWMIAGGGGGDTKLMGAISVWLGFKLTLYLMIVSTAIVALNFLVVSVIAFFRFGFRGLKKQHSLAGNTDAKSKPLTAVKVRPRHAVPFAVPLAIAAWIVMLADATVVKGGQLGPKMNVPAPHQPAP
jgi:prepilin peptidase CpaA